MDETLSQYVLGKVHQCGHRRSRNTTYSLLLKSLKRIKKIKPSM